MTATVNFVAGDFGSSNGRMMLARWNGETFALSELRRFPCGPITAGGRLYCDVLNMWNEIKLGLSRYSSEVSRDLRSIGVDTWGVDFALLDRAGQLLGNPHHYRDPRTDGMVERAFALVPAGRIYEETGTHIMRANSLYQVLSMIVSGDLLLPMAETLVMLPDLLHYWLTGRAAIELTNASTTQMMDNRRGCWATTLLADLGIPASILPAVIEPGAVLGDVLPDVIAECGLRPGARVIEPGTHDTASAVAAVPEMDDRSAFISSGTWSLVGVESRTPFVTEFGRSWNFANEIGVEGTIRLLKNVDGMWLLNNCRAQWRREGYDYSWEELLALAEQEAPFRSLINPNAPCFFGVQDQPAAIRAYCRDTGQPAPETPGQIIRCCLESLALSYRVVFDALESLTGRTIETVRIVGGGSRNGMHCRLTANICQRQVVAGPAEATTLGNVMMQAIGSGELAGRAEGRRAIAASVERTWYDPGPQPTLDDVLDRFGGLLNRT